MSGISEKELTFQREREYSVVCNAHIRGFGRERIGERGGGNESGGVVDG